MFIASDRLKDKRLQHGVYPSSNSNTLGLGDKAQSQYQAVPSRSLKPSLEIFGLTMDMVNFVDMPRIE